MARKVESKTLKRTDSKLYSGRLIVEEDGSVFAAVMEGFTGNRNNNSKIIMRWDGITEEEAWPLMEEWVEQL